MKTEESIRILLSLFVTIEQNYHAIVFYEKYLSEERLQYPEIPSRKEDSIDEAISESLWFQLMIKTCAFLDEWDSFLGIQTNKEDHQKLMTIKKIVAPARREIMKWKDMKDFRNEVIAHNLRKSNKSFSLDNMSEYNCPQSTYEMFYLVQFLQRMVSVLTTNYPLELQNIIDKAQYAVAKERDYSNKRYSTLIKLKEALLEVDNNIKLNFNYLNK